MLILSVLGFIHLRRTPSKPSCWRPGPGITTGPTGVDGCIADAAAIGKVAEGKVHVTDVKGPLEEGWQHKVEAFVARIPIQG